jgi:hypothetical protein
VAYRYTDPNTRLVFSTLKGTIGQAGKIVQFWANAAGTTPIDVGLWSDGAPDTPGSSTGSNQLLVQADSMWPEMWDRDGVLDHMWIQAGTADDPGELYRVYCDADQRADLLTTAVTAANAAAATAQATAEARLPMDSAGRVNPVATIRRAHTPRIMSLIAGTEDETVAGSACTISADTTNTRIGGRAWQMTMAGAVTAYAVMSPVSPATSGLLPFPPAQAACAWVYLPDASKVNFIVIELSLNSGNSVLWSSNTLIAPAIPLVNGWNLIRLKTANGLQAVSASWGNVNRVRVGVQTNAATTATIGHVWLECPEKARMIFILDRGYKTFVTSGALARLRAAGVPVTWALDITLLGGHVGDKFEVVTEAEIAQYAAEGDSISFHSWDGSVTATYTAAEARADTAKCLKWLQARGYAGRVFRAAWTQDTAANSAAAASLLLAQAQSSMPSVRLGTWPPINPHNMERWNWYGRTQSEVDIHFDLLQKTHGLTLTYNHGVHEEAGNDSTPAEFDYWAGKLEAALDAGWLEAVTFEQLWLEGGGDFGWIGNDPVARYSDAAGAQVIKRVL